MKKQKTEAKSLRYDILLICVLLFASLLAVGITLLNRAEGASVVVEINGERVAEYSLADDGEFSLNGGTNVLVIKGGVAYLTYADCPDLVCVHTGKIKYVRQSIVCLPNRLSVTVVGDDGVDFAQ